MIIFKTMNEKDGVITSVKEGLLNIRLVHQMYLLRRNIIRAKKYNRRQLDMIYREEDLTPGYYEKIKPFNDRELEHQIGRLINWKKIISEIDSLEGDVIEFGSWRGFSLLWIAHFMERKGMFGKKIIGLDSFAGIPYKEGAFEKHAFSDTSLRVCEQNIFGSRKLYDLTKKQIKLGKYFYNQKREISNFLNKQNVKKFSFVHVDCDVSKSADEIFELMIGGDYFADKCYVLFDDYGCATEISKSIESFVERMRAGWNVELHSQTNLTRNYCLTRKK